MTSSLPAVPPRLYKYVTAGRLQVLEKECIRFTQPADLNDPWELKPDVDKLATEEQLERDILKPLFDDPDIQELINDVAESWESMPPAQRAKFPGGRPAFKKLARRRVLANPQLLSQTLSLGREIARKQMGAYSSDFGETFGEALADSFGVLSLTTNTRNNLMWSHYTGGHTGMVLEFDTSQPFFNRVIGDKGKVNHPRKVNYVAQRPTFASLQDLTALEPSKAIEALMFTKDKRWDYEEEWRIVNLLQSADETVTTGKDGQPLNNPIHLFKLPAACITGVILGAQMPEANRQTIINFIRTDPRYAERVTLSQAKISNRTFNLEIDPLA